jgi:hypothetical protein
VAIGGKNEWIFFHNERIQIVLLPEEWNGVVVSSPETLKIFIARKLQTTNKSNGND